MSAFAVVVPDNVGVDEVKLSTAGFAGVVLPPPLTLTVELTNCESVPASFVAVTVKVNDPDAVKVPDTTLPEILKLAGRPDAPKLVGELFAMMVYVNGTPTVADDVVGEVISGLSNTAVLEAMVFTA